MRHAMIPMGVLAMLLPCAGWAGECRVSGEGIHFGRIDAHAPDTLHAIGHLAVQCTTPMDGVGVLLGRGSSPAGSLAMASGPHRLHYRVYQDAAGRVPFGDGSPGMPGITMNIPSPGIPVQIPLFAAIESAQPVPPGAYSEQVTVTISYQESSTSGP